MKNHKDMATKKHKRLTKTLLCFCAFLWLSFLMFGLAAKAVAAEKPTLADAA